MTFKLTISSLSQSNNQADVSTEQQQDAASQQKAAHWAALAEGDPEDLEAEGVPDLQPKLNEVGHSWLFPDWCTIHV